MPRSPCAAGRACAPITCWTRSPAARPWRERPRGAPAAAACPRCVRATTSAALLAAAAAGSLRDGRRAVRGPQGRVEGRGPGEAAGRRGARRASARAGDASMDRDPRHVQVVLDEAAEVVRDERVLICRTRHGFVCANAGVDASNAGEPDASCCCPLDPDAWARALRAALRELRRRAAVLVTDSFGRAWRHGQSRRGDRLAGLAPLDDWRGRADRDGRELRRRGSRRRRGGRRRRPRARGKDSGEPAVVVRGLERFVTPRTARGGRLIRPLTKTSSGEWSARDHAPRRRGSSVGAVLLAVGRQVLPDRLLARLPLVVGQRVDHASDRARDPNGACPTGRRSPQIGTRTRTPRAGGLAEAGPGDELAGCRTRLSHGEDPRRSGLGRRHVPTLHERMPGIAAHGLRSGLRHTAKAEVPPSRGDTPGRRRAAAGSAMRQVAPAADHAVNAVVLERPSARRPSPGTRRSPSPPRSPSRRAASTSPARSRQRARARRRPRARRPRSPRSPVPAALSRIVWPGCGSACSTIHAFDPPGDVHHPPRRRPARGRLRPGRAGAPARDRHSRSSSMTPPSCSGPPERPYPLRPRRPPERVLLADVVERRALGRRAAGARARRRSSSGGSRRDAVVAAGEAADVLLHQRAAEVVDAPAQRLGRGVEAHLHPARLHVGDRCGRARAGTPRCA